MKNKYCQMTKKDINLYLSDKKSKSSKIVVAYCTQCFLKIKFADIRLISLEHITFMELQH